jgi:hypothetical protein
MNRSVVKSLLFIYFSKEQKVEVCPALAGFFNDATAAK